MNASSLRWGIILIALGSLWLLVRGDVLDGDVFWRLLSLWPILLIAWGIEIIFRKTKAAWMAYASPLIVFLGVVAVAWGSYYWDGKANGDTWTREIGSDTRLISAVIDLDNYDFEVKSIDANAISGNFRGVGCPPEILFTQSGESATIELGQSSGWCVGPGSSISGIFEVSGEGLREMVMKLPTLAPVAFILSGAESHATLDLTEVPLRSLEGDVEGVRMSVRLGGKERQVTLKLRGPDNRFRLETPLGSGLRVRSEGYESYLESLGLVKGAAGFESPGFDTLTPQVEIDLDDDLSSLSIDYY